MVFFHPFGICDLIREDFSCDHLVRLLLGNRQLVSSKEEEEEEDKKEEQEQEEEAANEEEEEAEEEEEYKNFHSPIPFQD